MEEEILALNGTVPDWRACMAAFEAALLTAEVAAIEHDIALAY